MACIYYHYPTKRLIFCSCRRRGYSSFIACVVFGGSKKKTILQVFSSLSQDPSTPNWSDSDKTIIIMSFELATQISALVGTSLLLFIAMSPPPRNQDDEESHESSSSSSSSSCRRQQRRRRVDPTGLEGIKKYSSYHRKRVYRSMSNTSCSAIPTQRLLVEET